MARDLSRAGGAGAWATTAKSAASSTGRSPRPRSWWPATPSSRRNRARRRSSGPSAFPIPRSTAVKARSKCASFSSSRISRRARSSSASRKSASERNNIPKPLRRNTMKYLCLVYGQEQALQAMDDRHCVAYDEEIRRSGHCVASEALQPVSTATTVRVRNGKVSVTDGPFAETKECLAGFYMIEARDLNEAIQIASRIPPAQVGSVEVRPIRPIRETVRAMEKEGASHGVR